MGIAALGFCGSDPNSFRGRNPLVSYARIPGHEVSSRRARGRAWSGETLDDRKLDRASRAGAARGLNSTAGGARARLQELTGGDGPAW